MKIRKLTALILALVIALALVPAAAVAEGVSLSVQETAKLKKLDRVWAALDNAEADALASGADRKEVINAVCEAALNIDGVDNDSFSDFNKDGFFFTVEGMYCSYNYRLRNEIDNSGKGGGQTVIIPSNGKNVPLRDAESPDVLLVGPYYGQDGNFTDQYRNEAASIADATGGTVTELSGYDATGPAIAENYADKGVVIYDSHGCQSGDSSYLCLTTNEGITSEDYQNGWAVNAGNAAYIDGRYIEHHAETPLANCFVWMAICEGMKKSGNGTTGTALLNAGAGAVYGYSQSVSFTGDYLYEETFWNAMKNENDPTTVAEAFAIMVDTHGVVDPVSGGDAYPIVMSETDPFPANPDSPQTVTSDWLLFGNPEPVALTGFSLDPTAVEMYIGRSENISFVREPNNANAYELIWSSDNEAVAIVSGSKRRASVTGLSEGTAVITCTVMVDGEVFGTAQADVTVNIDTTLYDSLNVPGGTIQFGTSEGYGFEAVEEGGRYYAKSNNDGAGGSQATLTATLGMLANDTLDFEYFVSSENNYDWYDFTVNGAQMQHLSGTSMTGWETYTFNAPESGVYTFVWSYKKDGSVNKGEDCVKLDNVEFIGGEPVALTGFSLDPTDAEIYIGRSAEINFIREPLNANSYELTWSSDNENVAAVEGNNRRATVTGISCGTANIVCTVMADGEVFGTASCTVSVVIDTSLCDALNVEHGTLQFATSEPYGFEAVTEGGRFLVKSNNGGASESEATLTSTVEMESGETLSFEYFVSSEDNYDWYTFTVNGAQKQHLSGPNGSWAAYTFTAPSAGNYTFVWSYKKDYSVDGGQDCVKLDNVVYSGDPGDIIEPDGDIDLDGSVTTIDALLALRYAMGLINLTDEQLAHGDLNGSGNVDTVDAVMILRLAMGI